MKKNPLKKNNDLELIALIKEGSPKAQEVLYNRYKKIIRHTASRKLIGIMEPDDFVQIIFLTVFRKIDTYQPTFKFTTWLMRTVHNKIIDIYRKKKLETLSLNGENKDEETEVVYDVQDSCDDPRETMERTERYQSVHDAVNSLPEKYKKITVARFFEEKSLEEISEEFQMPLGTVKAQIHRIKFLLKEALNEKEFAA